MYGYKHYQFSLAITKEQLLQVYKGNIHRFRVKTVQNLVLDIDANHLKKFTTQDGIYGNFELLTTQDNKFVEIKKLD